jgi:hypothetical protein
MEIRVVGVTFLHVDRQAEEETDRQMEGLIYMTKLTGDFRDNAIVCTNDLMFCSKIASLLNIIRRYPVKHRCLCKITCAFI